MGRQGGARRLNDRLASAALTSPAGHPVGRRSPPPFAFSGSRRGTPIIARPL